MLAFCPSSMISSYCDLDAGTQALAPKIRRRVLRRLDTGFSNQNILRHGGSLGSPRSFDLWHYWFADIITTLRGPWRRRDHGFRALKTLRVKRTSAWTESQTCPQIGCIFFFQECNLSPFSSDLSQDWKSESFLYVELKRGCCFPNVFQFTGAACLPGDGLEKTPKCTWGSRMPFRKFLKSNLKLCRSLVRRSSCFSLLPSFHGGVNDHGWPWCTHGPIFIFSVSWLRNSALF